ncbi:hypothetical protein [Ralstonia holmesii]|uniref:hypothetical protein n=1 Tax=Ralstonia holmesii TaxID=3058602 RepID=UPI003D64883D
MKRLYARLLLRLIEPALIERDLRRADELRREREALPPLGNSDVTETSPSAFSRAAQAFRAKLKDLPCSD